MEKFNKWNWKLRLCPLVNVCIAFCNWNKQTPFAIYENAYDAEMQAILCQKEMARLIFEEYVQNYMHLIRAHRIISWNNYNLQILLSRAETTHIHYRDNISNYIKQATIFSSSIKFVFSFHLISLFKREWVLKIKK